MVIAFLLGSRQNLGRNTGLGLRVNTLCRWKRKLTYYLIERYVSISRASRGAMVFTDDIARLGPQLGFDVSKTSALEVDQPSFVTWGVGIAF
jgi:hypothetical protein